MSYLMGIDVGTSSVKVIIIDKNGYMLTLAKSDEYNISCLHNGWAEQDPNDWWYGCQTAIARALSASGITPNKIICIGLSGQMHSLVSLDQNFDLVRTTILHCDSRSGQQVKRLMVLLGDNQIIDLTKNPIHTGYTLPSLINPMVRCNFKVGGYSDGFIPKYSLFY
jgi:xylulokinase